MKKKNTLSHKIFAVSLVAATAILILTLVEG